MIVLHAPEREGRNLRLAGDVVFQHGDSIKIVAEVAPETIAWAKRTAARFARDGRRWADRALSWARRNVQLRGDWSALGHVGAVAADVLAAAEETGGPRLRPSDPALAYAARHVLGAAPAGPPPSPDHVRAVEIALDVLGGPDPAGQAQALWLCGDQGSQWVLSAMCLLGGKAGAACCSSCAAGPEIVYDVEDAFGASAIERTAKRAVNWTDHYRRFRALPGSVNVY